MSRNLADLKVAIVCDWLTGIGGAERVVFEFHKLFPKAPIYTSQYDPTNIDWFKDADIRTGYLQKLPKSLKKFLPQLRARYFSKLDLSEYDLVISSSGAEAKSIKFGPNTIHVSYCHSPTHYYWTRYKDYIDNPGFGALSWIAKLGLKTFVGPMRKWDYKAAQKPSYLIANSNYTKENIKKYYDRESTIIHPPVDVDRFNKNLDEKRHGFVIAGRQTPYKMIDLAVSACTKLSLELKVIGSGPENLKLNKLAGPTITFLNSINDEEIAKHFQAAEAFIFPGIDDFGIVAVEALASGTPVIAYIEGGSRDYINTSTGLFFENQTTESLSNALEEFKSHNFNHQEVSSYANKFSTNNFDINVSEFLNKIL